MSGAHRAPARERAPAVDRAQPAPDVQAQSPGVDGERLRRKQVRGSALLLVGRIVSLLLTTATQVVIVRALTKTQYGAFAYALTLAAAGLTLLSLGQGKLLSRFMAKYEEQRDYDRMFGCMVLAGLTILVTTTVAMGALFLFPGTLIGSAVHDPAAIKVVLVLVFLGPLDALDQVFVSLFAVFSRPGAIFVRKYLFTPVLRLIIVVVLALTGSSMMFLAVGYVAAGVAGLGVSLLVFVQVMRERNLLSQLHLRTIKVPARSVLSFSMPLITGELFFLSLNFGGVVILGAFHSVAAVASYRAVFSPARLNNSVQQVFVPLFLPLVARLSVRTDTDGLRNTYWHTAAFVAVLTFPVFAMTGPLAPVTTVVLFGRRYADSAIILMLLAFAYYFSVSLGLNTYMLQVCGRIRFLVVVNVVTSAFNLALTLLLVQRFSAVGVAVANAAAIVVQNIWTQLALRKAINTSFIGRGYLRCYGAILGCTALLCVFQVVVRPGLVPAMVAATAASLIVLLVSRRSIELAETFPELRRMPLVRRFV